METTHLPEARLSDFLAALASHYRLIWLAAEEPAPADPLQRAAYAARVFSAPRGPHPARGFFLPQREAVAEFPLDAGKPARRARLPEAGAGNGSRPPALLNLRPCDLAAVRILDRVFLEGDFVDPFYQRRRMETLLVSVDCEAPAPACFCDLVGGAPFAERGMGLHLSRLEAGYLVVAEGEAAARVVRELGLEGVTLEDGFQFERASRPAPVEAGYLVSADGGRSEQTPGEREGRGHEASQTLGFDLERRRAAACAQLARQNERFRSPRSPHTTLVERSTAAKWQDLAAACVECGACTRVCPTCYCFYLFDTTVRENEGGVCRRLRTLDSCLFADYARMAGAPQAKPNPRPRLRSRFENRFRHKLQYHYETHGEYACVGCGRCAEVCLGSTDPREVLRVLDQ